jgi:hypothetical protein
MPRSQRLLLLGGARRAEAGRSSLAEAGPRDELADPRLRHDLIVLAEDAPA